MVAAMDRPSRYAVRASSVLSAGAAERRGGGAEAALAALGLEGAQAVVGRLAPEAVPEFAVGGEGAAPPRAPAVEGLRRGFGRRSAGRGRFVGFGFTGGVSAGL